ncbi:sulfite exporter TauE/SafE family protein [Endozoicomonas sp. 8E]|uniref:sulfite exporter TauE/SafE family protein n=1 Tax=Endozoicomonas sp. 8E TaxID=3035692 RepID=UPI002938DD59|nr:sulfite exporter TauE/SafE family protein [Endozoicomonas sp. 8E]WOG29424.1 sulfite exporter TauE/SafE family protein [Endozoicomonas sp. 8E]
MFSQHLSSIPEFPFFITAIPAVVITGLGKGGMGNALGMLAVPLMSLSMRPIQAAAILLPLLLVMDGFAVWGWRKHIDWTVFRIIIFPGLFGLFLGLMVFASLSEQAIRGMIGIIAILFCLKQWFGHYFHSPRKPGTLAGIFWSTVSGFTSFGIHSGGPPLSVYMLPLKLKKEFLAGTMAIFFGSLNLVKCPAYAALGQFTPDNLLLSSLLLPVCPLGVWLGMKMVKTISTDFFYKVLYICLFLTGLKLLTDSF